MILKFKNLLFISIIVLGYYAFYYDYKDLINLETSAKQKITQIDILKSKNNKKEIEKNSQIAKNKNININDKKILNLKEIVITVSPGDTFMSILKKNQIEEKDIFRIVSEIESIFDLKKLKVKDKISFFKDFNNKIKKIEINNKIDSSLIINIDKNITVERKEFEKLSFEASSEFKITESLYSDGLKNKLPEDILIKLIKLYSFDLDFQRDIKKGTHVSVSYGYNQIIGNNRLQYKDINYALISIDNKKLEYFKFLTDDGFIDYFNKEGKNVKKSILKTPLDGARLSSSFGMRKHPISGYNKMHKGVDFAAPQGTPIYAGGNGVIEYVGYNGGYGKYIRIRHNNEYKTAYAHLSKYKKGITKGKRVNQGEIIGYVGSTGNSTGPHLHYEILFQNKHINPLKLTLPSGKILKGNELERFKKEYKTIYANHLNLLYE